MRRRLLTLLSILSLLLFGVTIAAWTAAGWSNRPTEFTIGDTRWAFTLKSSGFLLDNEPQRLLNREPQLSLDRERYEQAKRHSAERRMYWDQQTGRRRLTAQEWEQSHKDERAASDAVDAAIRAVSQSESPRGPVIWYSLKYMTVVFITAAFPIVVVVVRLLAAHKRERAWSEGWCMQCGYDLRGSSGRCPECGTAPAPDAYIRRIRQRTSGSQGTASHRV
jgi:hypothetical protein